MEINYIAHISEDGRKQSVSDHLVGTAELCERFASEFGAGGIGRIIGTAHDIGKYSAAFQKRIIENGPKVDHSTAGAFECAKQKNIPAAYCVACHHSGLLNRGSRTDAEGAGTFFSRINKANKGNIPQYDDWKAEISLPKFEPPKIELKSEVDMEFFIRMLFSCLTDADFLDTEVFMNPLESERPEYDNLHILTNKLDEYISGWFTPKTDLNKQRLKILERCIEMGDSSKSSNLFTLTVPTGGGKTVSSLAFALHHARANNLKRIVYVIPYTSIIEQNSEVFKRILGDENVLEHHSAVNFSADEATIETQKIMKAAENWDVPIIVTTAVQFFESLYGNRSSKCRKNHNLANSVIIFDEAQMLPMPYLVPCVSAISQLVKNYGVSAVLCTATQPALDHMFEEFIPDKAIVEICPEGAADFEKFTRVRFDVRGKLDWQSVADMMIENNQCLCIVNTRKSAKELYDLIEFEDGVYHLSTLMCPAHRKSVLDEVRERLTNGKACKVVSTSLIEAGVDVDFPTVLREMAGLDSILQAAGRCNREGKMSAEHSVVVVFESEQRIPELFRTQTDVSAKIIREYGNELLNPKAIKNYFELLLKVKGSSSLDSKGIMKLISSFDYSTLSEQFSLIDSKTRDIYVPFGEGAECIERLKNGERSRDLFRKAGHFSVSVYENHFVELYKSAGVDVLNSIGGEEIWILSDMELYSDESGLSLDADTGKALFI